MRSIKSSLLAALSLASLGLAQDEGVVYTDRESGIIFNTWAQKDLTFGMALPSNGLTTDATEFIGLLTCASTSGQGTGWCGLSLGGGMVNNLLLIAYPQQGQVLTSFRWATEYGPPALYTGNAKLTQVSSVVNSTHYSVIFRCQDCLKWNQGGEEGAAPTSAGFLVLGWCHATASPSNGACENNAAVRRHTTEGIFGAVLNSAAANPSYSTWAGKATKSVSGNCVGSVTTSIVTLPPATTRFASPTIVPGPGAGCARTYTVVPGDYCYLIATNNGLSLDQFLSINPGLVCEPLRIGTVVCLRR